jgi:hypothetical protein
MQRFRAAGHHRRHVFLDRHLALEVVVEGPVDDAEAPDAEHPDDLELAQPGADRQGAGGIGRGADGVGRH